MTLTDFQELLSSTGQSALAFAESIGMAEANRLATLQTLRKRYPAPLSTAVLDTVLLRAKAKVKFADAAKMYFTREAFEQSTGEVVAAYRVSRFSGRQTILDIGCGIGGDLIAFAKAGHTVIGIERDELRAAIATANLHALSRPGHVLSDDALTTVLPQADAVFCDPARRNDGQRILSPEESTPQPSQVISRFSNEKPIAFKLAPGVNVDEVLQYDGEIDFVSLDGELKECMLWLGPLKSCDRRATVLDSQGQRHTLTGDGSVYPPIGSPGEYLYDPDSSIVRPNLTGILAETLALQAIDGRVATLTGRKIDSPFAQRFRILTECDLDVKKVTVELRRLDAKSVTVIKRGVIIDTEPLTKKWSGSGSQHLTVFLTPVEGRPRAFIVIREN